MHQLLYQAGMAFFGGFMTAFGIAFFGAFMTGCGIIFVTLYVCYCKSTSKQRMSKESATCIESCEKKFLRLSYADLLKATCRLSQAKLVGSGRFGSVYKGSLDDGQTLVAVKVLNLSVKGASESFMAECNAIKGLRHRNLLRIVSVCSSTDFDGKDFKALVYEYKANGSLDTWLHHHDKRMRYLTLIQRLNIAIDIASALEYLHCGTDSIIVHGDLKPSNILVDYDMIACIGDFGLTKIISNNSAVLQAHDSSSTIEIKGTVGYIAPEYGTSGSVTTKGDVYSYGIILLEMFTNKRPTDDAFKDHLNIHNFVSHALPDNIIEILDPLIMHTEQDMNSRTKELLVSVLSIGVTCSNNLVRDRMSITDVVSELQKIRYVYLCPTNLRAVT